MNPACYIIEQPLIESVFCHPEAPPKDLLLPKQVLEDCINSWIFWKMLRKLSMTSYLVIASCVIYWVMSQREQT